MSKRSIWLGATVLLTLAALAAAGCTSASQKELAAMKADLEAAKASRAEASNAKPAAAPASPQVAAAPAAPPAAAAAAPTAVVAPLSGNPQPAAQPATQPVSSGAGDLLAKGKLIFEKDAGGVGCAYCHGMEGKGGGPAAVGAPPNRGASEAKVRAALGGGVPLMSFIKLNDDEIKAVVAWLAELGKQP